MSTTKTSFSPLVAAVGLAATLLAGCSTTPPSQFYTLSAPVSAGTGSVAAAQGSPTFIEVMPVAVPERLARPQIVVRSGDTQVEVLEQQRWSAPFNNELRDALAAGISGQLGAVDVSRSGRPAEGVSYRIAVELRDLDAVRGGNVQAAFGWTVTRSDDRKTAVCRLSIAEPVAGNDVGAVVTAMQKMVVHTAGAIAANVRALKAGQSVQCQG